MAAIMEPSMLHVSAIPWTAVYGPQVKKTKRVPYTRKQWAELNTKEFWKGIKGYEIEKNRISQ
jgi:hypothetical protein